MGQRVAGRAARSCEALTIASRVGDRLFPDQVVDRASPFRPPVIWPRLANARMPGLSAGARVAPITNEVATRTCATRTKTWPDEGLKRAPNPRCLVTDGRTTGHESQSSPPSPAATGTAQRTCACRQGNSPAAQPKPDPLKVNQPARRRPRAACFSVTVRRRGVGALQPGAARSRRPEPQDAFGCQSRYEAQRRRPDRWPRPVCRRRRPEHSGQR